MARLLGKLKDFTQKGTGTTVEDITMCLKRLGKLEVVHEGWLVKRGKVRKSWKRRYFALVSPGVLMYFEDPAAVSKLKEVKARAQSGLSSNAHLEAAAEAVVDQCDILGTLTVRKMPVTRVGAFEDKQNVFTVQAPPPSNRVFYFSAESPDDVNKWEEMIRHMDNFEERQREQERREEEEKEHKRHEAIRAKYLQLLPTAKDPFTGGTIRCGDEVWRYTSGGAGDQAPAFVEQIAGRHANKGIKFAWNGTVISMGQVSMVGDDKGGWGLWNGKRMEWRTPASLDRRGKGQAWEYTADADMKFWKASAFTMRMNFPTAWKFVDGETLKPEGNSQPLDIPSEVTIEGSVPPMVAVACGMYNASRKESIIQTKILREIQAEEREKRILQEALERRDRGLR